MPDRKVLEDARRDVLAGLTVTLVGLPQCLAYALMSGLPPAYGLSTAAVAGLVAALVGRSPHVVTGPTNTTGLLILGALGSRLDARGLLEADGRAALATLTLMAGGFRLIVAYLGGAKLLRYLPESVLAGFTAGAGVLIGVMQLDEALGLEALSGGGLLGQLKGLGARLSSGALPALPDVGLTVLTILGIHLGSRRWPGWPTALIVVILGGLLAFFVEGTALSVRLVHDRAALPSGWPPGALPSLEPHLLGELTLPALAIVLLGTLELTVSARTRGAKPEMRREIIAQGWANVAGAFFSGFPASASLTRSRLLFLSRAKTRLAPAAAAVFVFPVLFFGGEAVGYIPQASLAGVLLITALGMLDRARMARIWVVSRASRALLLVTLTSTLVLPLEVAILLGSGLGLLIHLSVSAEPRLRWLHLRAGELVGVAESERPQAVVAEVSGTLYYAAVPSFLERLQAELPASTRYLVVDVSHAHQLRFAALEGFEDLFRTLRERGVALVLSGVSAEFERVLRAARSPLPFERARATPGKSAQAALLRVSLIEEEGRGSFFA